MKLHQLIKSKGLRDKARRIGRGNATGTGNYSGRGLKGQKSRSGHGMKPFFEGGQTSIVQRLPKARGFTRYFKLVDEYQIINLCKLNLDTRVSDTMEISKASLKQLGYIKNEKGLVKILGDGEYTKHLTFTDIDAFSASAKIKIDKPGTASKTAGKPYTKIDKVARKAAKTAHTKKAHTKKFGALKTVAAKAPAKVVAKAPAKKVEAEVKVAAPAKAVAKAPVKKVEAEVKAPVKKAVVAKAPAKAVVKKAPVKKAK